jgi:F0F1-type ATP synthase assembly protein I
MGDPNTGYGLIFRLTLTLLGVFILPVLLGIWLDSQLHTSPFLTLFLIFIGTTMGTVAVSRRVAATYREVAGDKS